ncbi:MAG: exodeoxyribonuclease VII small subunit [Rickettsiales bacterium]
MENDKNIDNLSFEEALKQLQEIVREIESGQDSLDKIVAHYERGNKLKKYCESKLKEAKLKIEKIVSKNGEITSESMNSID